MRHVGFFLPFIFAVCPPGLKAQTSVLELLRPAFPQAGSARGFSILPLHLAAAFRSGWADDRDNGALWTGKGPSSLVRGGFAWARGPLHVTVAPEATWSANGAYPLADGTLTGHSSYSAPWIPVDLPRRWGEGARKAVTPGQSAAEVRWSSFALGASTQNQIRGPEARYPLMVGASAPGFPHAFVEGTTRIGHLGRVALRAQWGVLTESPYFDRSPVTDRTLFSAFFVDWSPAFANGLVLGATMTYRDALASGFSPSMLFRAFSTTSIQDPEQLDEDGLAALHARWDSGPLLVWGSWGRNDYWGDTEDLLTDPDQSQLYDLGLSLAWEGPLLRWTMTGELASLAETNPRSGWIYRHGADTSTGHTHEGQMLGASIGPGSRGAYVSVQRADSLRTLGVEVERIVHDMTVYNEVFAHRDGAKGQDREWRLGLIYAGAPTGVAPGGVTVQLNAGFSLRWNRDYIQYSSNAALVGSRETNLFVDLGVTWDAPR